MDEEEDIDKLEDEEQEDWDQYLDNSDTSLLPDEPIEPETAVAASEVADPVGTPAPEIDPTLTTDPSFQPVDDPNIQLEDEIEDAPVEMVDEQVEPVEEDVIEMPADDLTANESELDLLMNSSYDPNEIDDVVGPDFRRLDYAQAVDEVQKPLSVDINASARNLKNVEQNLTFAEREENEAENKFRLAKQGRDAAEKEYKDLSALKNPTPEQQAQLEAAKTKLDQYNAVYEEKASQYNTAVNNTKTAKEKLGRARGQYDSDYQVATAENEQRKIRLENAKIGAQNAEFEAAERKALADKAVKDSEIASAEKQLAEDRKAYRDALEKGPQWTGKEIGIAIALALSEGLQADAAGRQPDFSKAFDVLTNQMKDEFKRKIEAKLDGLEDTGDSITKKSKEKDIIDAELATQKVAISDKLIREVEFKIATSKDPLTLAQLTTTRDNLRREREKAVAEALQKNQDSSRKSKKLDADIKLQEARTAKEQALAAKATAEARKAAGGGGSGRGSVQPGTADAAANPYILRMPGSDDVLINFQDKRFGSDEAQRAAAKKATEEVNAIFETQAQLDEYIALLEDYGTRSFSSALAKDEALALLEQKRAALVPALGRFSANGFSATDTDTKWAEENLLLPGFFSNTEALTKAKGLQGTFETRARKTGQNNYLTQEQQNKLIIEARNQSHSKNQKKNQILSQAGNVILNKNEKGESGKGTYSTEDRKKALEVKLSDNRRKDDATPEIQDTKDLIDVKKSLDQNDPLLPTVIAEARKRQRDLRNTISVFDANPTSKAGVSLNRYNRLVKTSQMLDKHFGPLPKDEPVEDKKPKDEQEDDWSGYE